MRKFQVGKWTVEPAAGRLCRPEIEPLPLEAGVMGVLVALLEEPRRWWSKAELVDAVWQGRSVGDNEVHRAVAVLRRILGSSGQPTIETIPDRGYRWVGPAEVLEDSPRRQLTETSDPTSTADDGLEPHDVLTVETRKRRRSSASGMWATWAIAVGLAVGLGTWASGSSSSANPAVESEPSLVRFVETSTPEAETTRLQPRELTRVDGLPIDLRRLLESVRVDRRSVSEDDRVGSENRPVGWLPSETEPSDP